MALSVTDLTPADNATGVERDYPIDFQISHTSSNYQKVMETTLGEFADGTLEGIDVNSNGSFQLSSLNPFNPGQATFENDTTGQFPKNFWDFSAYGTWTVQSFGGSNRLKAVVGTTREGMVCYQGVRAHGNYEVKVQLYMVDDLAESAGVAWQIWPSRTWAQRYLRMAGLSVQSQYLYMGRYVGGSYTSDGTAAKTIAPGEWWNIRIKNCYERYWAKAWKVGTSEPGTWDIGGTDGIYSENNVSFGGSVGLFSSASTTTYFDALTLTRTNTRFVNFFSATDGSQPYDWATLWGGNYDNSHVKMEWGDGEDRGKLRLYGFGVATERAIYYKEGGTFRDFDIYWHHIPYQSNNEAGFLFRITNSAPFNGYVAKWNRPLSRIELQRCDAGVFTTLAYASKTGSDIAFRMRIQAIGGNIKIKCFYFDPLGTSAEPAGWLIEYTDTTYENGYFGLRHFDTSGNGVWTKGIEWAPLGDEEVNSSSFKFNGTDNEVDCGNASGIKPTTAVTAEAWVWKKTSSGTKTILAWTSQYGYAIWWSSDNVLVGVRTDAGGGTWYATTGMAVTQDAWNHVAMTYDGTTLKFFLNGVHQSAQNVAVTGAVVYSGNLHFGNTDGGTTWAPIWLAEVRAWSVARTEAQIADNRTTRLLGTESNLVGYWKFDEGIGTVIREFSSTGATGTLAGTQYWGKGSWVSWTYQRYPPVSVGSSTTYLASGKRTSPAWSLATANLIGGIRKIEWDATTPTGTSITMKTSVNGGTWRTVSASGDAIQDLALDDNVASGTLAFETTLATSDVTKTPVVSEIRAIFQEQDPADVLVTCNGVDFTVANGKLVSTGEFYTSGNPDRGLMRYHSVAGVAKWWTEATRDASVTLLVKYAGTTKSTTAFKGAIPENMALRGANSWWTAWDSTFWWKNASGSLYYYVPDFASTFVFLTGNMYWFSRPFPTSQMDAYYWVAHAFFRDTPASGIAGAITRADDASSGVVEGWSLGDSQSGGVVQGWMLPVTPLAGIVGITFLSDPEPASGIVAVVTSSLTPGSGIVYEVNRNNIIELKAIGVQMQTILDALGITVSD